MEYDFDESGEADEPTFWEEVGKNWQRVALRGVFILCACGMALAILICCCTICCRVWCHSLKGAVCPCQGFIDHLTAYYEDPMYKRAKSIAELMGLKLDYETFLKIKDSHDMEGSGAFNPLGLPHMG